MESHLVRIINRLEMMADGGNLKRNFDEGVVVAEVSFSNDPENGPIFTTLKHVNLIHLIAST